MARPRGFRLNRAALEIVMRLRGVSMTTTAEVAGIKLKTLSGLAADGHGASIEVAHAIARSLDCPVEALFPELGRFRYEPAVAEAVAG